MLIPLTLIILAVVVWLVWQWRCGALLRDAPVPGAGSSRASARSHPFPNIACDPRPAASRPYLVVQRRGLVRRSPARDAA